MMDECVEDPEQPETRSNSEHTKQIYGIQEKYEESSFISKKTSAGLPFEKERLWPTSKQCQCRKVDK